MIFDFARSRSGPPREVAEPSEGLKGPSLVIVVVGDLGGNGIVLTESSKGVIIPLMEPVLVRGLCHHAGRALDGIREDIKGLVIGRGFIKSVKWVVETAGQADVVLLRPGRSDAGYAEGERATGEREPRCPNRGLEGPSLMVSIVFDIRRGVEGVAIDGLTFEIGFNRGERTIGDPGSGEVEPRDLEDIQIPNAGDQRSVGNGDNQEGDGVSKVCTEECGGKDAIRRIQRRETYK